jgi:hypothetical protein
MPIVQMTLVQSSATLHFFPSPQAGALGPPQPTSVSVLLASIVMSGDAQTLLRQMPLTQSGGPSHGLPSAHFVVLRPQPAAPKLASFPPSTMDPPSAALPPSSTVASSPPPSPEAVVSPLLLHAPVASTTPPTKNTLPNNAARVIRRDLREAQPRTFRLTRRRARASVRRET